MEYYGEQRCSYRKKDGSACTNWAYYLYETKLSCGVHAKDKSHKLPKNPVKVNRQEEWDKARILDGRGTVCVTTLRMMKKPEYKQGYIPIFPNFKHGGRTDGLGMPALSPKAMGPIDHGQPGLPLALNLENFHQANKVFASEVNGEGNPLPVWYERRLALYQDLAPHRHKLGNTKQEHLKNAGMAGNPNVCLYSIVVHADGKEVRYSYVESRKFYCGFYERIARETPEYKRLEELLSQGYHLQIFGYDGYPVTKSLQEHYLDPERPFGHEMVLYSMLVGEHPWR